MNKKALEMLYTLQERPGVYFGKKSLRKLTDFMVGYLVCLHQFEENPDYLDDFQRFVEKYYNLDKNVHCFRYWDQIIDFFSPTDEIAFDTFFELLEKYLKVENEYKISDNPNGIIHYGYRLEVK